VEKFQVLFNWEAAAEFEELLGNTAVVGLAKRYLKELHDFPPEAWGDIHRSENQIYFKSDNHVLFDIQGKVLLDERGFVCGVGISRFRLRRRV
jgi:hypothetical protein